MNCISSYLIFEGKNYSAVFTESRPCNTGLLLHFQSHVGKRYKTGSLKTMLHRAHTPSSTTEAFIEECDKLRSILSRPDYPIGLINSIIDMLIQNIATKPEKETDDDNNNNMRANFVFSRSATGYLIALFTNEMLFIKELRPRLNTQ